MTIYIPEIRSSVFCSSIPMHCEKRQEKVTMRLTWHTAIFWFWLRDCWSTMISWLLSHSKSGNFINIWQNSIRILLLLLKEGSNRWSVQKKNSTVILSLIFMTTIQNTVSTRQWTSLRAAWAVFVILSHTASWSVCRNVTWNREKIWKRRSWSASMRSPMLCRDFLKSVALMQKMQKESNLALHRS